MYDVHKCLEALLEPSAANISFSFDNYTQGSVLSQNKNQYHSIIITLCLVNTQTLSTTYIPTALGLHFITFFSGDYSRASLPEAT